MFFEAGTLNNTGDPGTSFSGLQLTPPFTAAVGGVAALEAAVNINAASKKTMNVR